MSKTATRITKSPSRANEVGIFASIGKRTALLSVSRCLHGLNGELLCHNGAHDAPDVREVDFALQTVEMLVRNHGIALHSETLINSDWCLWEARDIERAPRQKTSDDQAEKYHDLHSGQFPFITKRGYFAGTNLASSFCHSASSASMLAIC